MPLQHYFAQQGIATEIRTRRGRYILVTKKRFEEDPAKAEPGTAAYQFFQRVIDIGVHYKAPPGNLTFAPESFRGAYGIKVKD